MLDKIQGNFVQSISECEANCTNVQNFAEPLWFAVFLRWLFGATAWKDIRFHFGDRWSERTYRAWADGDSDPSPRLLLVLLRTPNGRKVLDYIMRDSDAAWWKDHQRALRIAAQIDKLDLR